jgi:hypothetical protein
MLARGAPLVRSKADDEASMSGVDLSGFIHADIGI